jgi:hypothetical protein
MTTLRGTRRFMAVIGLVGTPTNEHFPRILTAPEPGVRIRPEWLLPVRGDDGGRMVPVGTIYDVVVLGRELIALGYLKDETETDRVRIKALADGELFMELDVDRAQWTEDLDYVTFTSWRVSAVTLGTNPTWDLPRVHVWEG